MNARTLTFALTRPPVMTFLAIGAGMLWVEATTAALVMFAIAAAKTARVLSWPDLEDRLRLRDEKRSHGIHRTLSARERDEILALDTYGTLLTESGADPSLAHEARHEAWRIIKSAGRNDAATRLRQFRQSLPPLPKPEDTASEGTAGIARRIEQELALLHATRREVEAVG